MLLWARAVTEGEKIKAPNLLGWWGILGHFLKPIYDYSYKRLTSLFLSAVLCQTPMLCHHQGNLQAHPPQAVY